MDQGSYGIVKLARDTNRNDTRVALKLIDSGKIKSNNKMRHVMREQDILFGLNYKHIIKIYETFEYVSFIFQFLITYFLYSKRKTSFALSSNTADMAA